MTNVSLHALSGQGSGSANLVEMKREELMKVEGGGLKDWIADIVHAIKCSCAEDPHASHTEWHPGMNFF